jgi:hypothetical protein
MFLVRFYFVELLAFPLSVYISMQINHEHLPGTVLLIVVAVFYPFLPTGDMLHQVKHSVKPQVISTLLVVLKHNPWVKISWHSFVCDAYSLC